ncbi:MAG: DUF6175 family protein [Bacteroidota bacterium]
MKKIFIILLFAIMNGIGFGQAKKPTIMVLPSDAWCKENHYVLFFDNQGTKEEIPDYKRAFQDMNLLPVIAKIGGMMADRGFPLIDAESRIKSLASESAEDAMLQSKSGGNVAESPIDKLKKIAKADIIIQLTYSVNTQGPKRSITFTLKGLDSYSDKQIAAATGTGLPSFSADLPVLMEEAVLAHLDNFNSGLQQYFNDLFANGREITMRIKKFDTWDGDLQSEYGGKELGSIIEDWLNDNTVQKRYNTTDATENMMFFEQVRIPMQDKNNNPIDARGFGKGLQSFLRNPPYNIVSKLMTKGLGQATIVLGEK